MLISVPRTGFVICHQSVCRPNIQPTHLPFWIVCTGEYRGCVVIAGGKLRVFFTGIGASDQHFASQFSALLGASALFDLIWMFQNPQVWVIRMVSVLILLFKVI